MLLSPALYVIAKFGGIRPLARALDIDQAYVYRWKKNGIIPSKHHTRLIAIAKDHKIRITASDIVFGRIVSDTWIKKNLPSART